MSTQRSFRSHRPGVLAPPLRISAFVVPGRAVVVRLDGDVGQDQRRRLEAALGRAVALRPPRLVVDLAGLGFCDSSCVNALLGARLAAQAAAVELLLAAPTAQARRLLEITGTDGLFTVRPSVRAALVDVGAEAG
ncbi:STAS domain-containing protein [Kitasatospora sp. NPDC101235]|uniref:STAS domain-containing protein n=1 Tax=Kitasatospora sp. NPDC101235 TaxID=3364101 RepID=UPI003826AAB4